MIFFETQDLIANALTLEDTARFHAICNQPFVLKWMADWELDRGEVKKLLRHFIKGYEISDPKRHSYAMALRLKRGGQLIGICGFGPKEELGGEVEICYFIDEIHSNRGYMGQAVKGAIAFYFDHFNEPFLSAMVNSENIPSCRLLRGNGFFHCPLAGAQNAFRLYRPDHS